MEESDSEEDSSSDEEGAEGDDEDQGEDSAEEGAGESHGQMLLLLFWGPACQCVCWVGPGRLPVSVVLPRAF